jgi:hypothetical protein
MPLWSVYLAIVDAEVPAVRDAAPEVLPADRHAIVTEILEGGTEGATQLALDVEAGSLSGAISAAEGEWARLRAHAGLRKAAAHLVYIVGPLDESAPLHDRLLLRARQFLAVRQPSYALVAAVSAFEVYGRQLVRDLAARDMRAELTKDVWLLYKAARPAAQKRFLEDLLGRSLADAGQLWTDYTASVQSRHGVVHEGGEVDSATAESALTSIRGLIAWVENAVQSRG